MIPALTKREFFSAIALHAVLDGAFDGCYDPGEEFLQVGQIVAKRAVMWADYLIAELEAEQETGGEE